MDGNSGIFTFASGATATVHHTTDRVCVTVVGDVDPCFSRPATGLIRFLAERGTPVDVDLGGVGFFSAAGAGWLASLYADVGTEVRVVAASDAVRRVLALCELPLQSSSTANRTASAPSP